MTTFMLPRKNKTGDPPKEVMVQMFNQYLKYDRYKDYPDHLNSTTTYWNTHYWPNLNTFINWYNIISKPTVHECYLFIFVNGSIVLDK